jgi:hypothetical protein
MCSERVAFAFASACAAALVSACAGTLDDPDRFRDGGAPTPPAAEAAAGPASTCPPIETGVLAPKCASAGCHTATGGAGNLDLASPDVLGRLANKAATGGPGSLVVPGDPDKSVLYSKLTATPPFGSRMPLGSNLDDATLACVHDWIAAAH